MTAQVITVGRKKYATGLFWQPLIDGQSAGDSARRTAKSIVGGAQLYTDYRGMYGLGFSASKHSTGMFAAAPEVCDSLSDRTSFVAAFLVKEGVWILAVRNGQILSDQDMLYSDDESARAAYMRLLELPDWGLRIAPSHWNIDHATEKHIDEVIFGTAKRSLKTLDRLKQFIISGLFIGMLLIMVFITFQKQIMEVVAPAPQLAQVNPTLLEEYRQKIIAQQKQEKEVISIADVMPLVLPYEQLPDITERANQCFRATAYIMQTLPGWVVLETECTRGQIIARIRRDYGTITDLYNEVENVMPGIQVKQTSDTDVNLFATLEKVSTKKTTPVENSEQTRREITALFQKMNMAVSMSVKQETIIHPKNQNLTKQVQFILVSAESKLSPMEFVKIFEPFASVEFSVIKWDNKKQSWIYEEKIYVK